MNQIKNSNLGKEIINFLKSKNQKPKKLTKPTKQRKIVLINGEPDY